MKAYKEGETQDESPVIELIRFSSRLVVPDNRHCRSCLWNHLCGSLRHQYANLGHILLRCYVPRHADTNWDHHCHNKH